MKSLNNTLTLFPNITLATKEDNKEILLFFNSKAMKDKNNSIIYERGSSFFNFLEKRSNKYLVFLIKDTQKIKGVCSISYREGYFNGSLQTIGYLGDLRIQSSLKYTRLWRKFANMFFLESHLFEETNYCLHYYTVLMDTNTQSQNNFTKTGLGDIKFTPIANYKMLNYLGKLSFSKVNNKVERCQLNQFIDFYNRDQERRYFGYCENEYKRRIASWENFDQDNLLCIKENSHIIATVSFWNPGSSKTIKLTNIPFYMRVLYNFLSLVTHLNLPKENQKLEIIYLNQIAFKKGLSYNQKFRILKSFLHHIEKSYKFNMISYCDFEVENLSLNISPDIHQTMNMKYYYVHHSTRDIIARIEDAPGFEMALV